MGDHEIDELDDGLHVGERIKRLREGACLSLDQLAERCGLDKKELQHVEEDLISPALGTLIKICDGLGVRMGHFFEQGPRKFYSLFRAGDEKVAARFASKNGADFGYEYHALGSEKRERFMEPFLVTISPPSSKDEKPIEFEELGSHSGEEFLFVLEGQILVELQDEEFVLGPGDSFYYDANMPHRVTHHGQLLSRVLAVVYLHRTD